MHLSESAPQITPNTGLKPTHQKMFSLLGSGIESSTELGFRNSAVRWNLAFLALVYCTITSF
jgi:hypothetical protein